MKLTPRDPEVRRALTHAIRLVRADARARGIKIKRKYLLLAASERLLNAADMSVAIGSTMDTLTLSDAGLAAQFAVQHSYR